MMRKSVLFCLTVAFAATAAAVPVPLPPTSLSFGGQAPPPPNNDVWFNSLSFGGLSLVPRDMYSTGGWVDLVGTDSDSGMTQPRSPKSPWGGKAVYPDSIQLIGDNPLTDQARSIETMTGPTGGPESVLKLTFVAPYNANVGGQSGNTGQNSYIIFPDGSAQQSMIYESWWVYLQSDFYSRLQSFFSVSETKTNSTERHTFGINKTNGTPTWQFSHNSAPSQGPFTDYYDVFLSPDTGKFPLQAGQTYVAPIPVGQWFRIEWAHKFVPGQPGWMWLALTVPGSNDAGLKAGRQVYFEQNSHWDPKFGELMNRIFQFQAYSDLTRSSSSPFSFYLSEMKIGTTWPSTATAHPAIN